MPPKRSSPNDSSADSSQDAEFRRAIKSATQKGQPFEVCKIRRGNSEYLTFRNAPLTLKQMVDESARFSDKEFVVFGDERYSFSQMLAMGRRVGNGLIARDIKPGDRVGIVARNSPQWVAAFMGIVSAGGVAVALNSWWTGRELAHGIRDSGMKCLFADEERLARLHGLQAMPEVDIIGIGASSTAVLSFDAFVEAAAESAVDVAIQPEDDATILYTSGSTAHPKGVVSSHRAIIHAVVSVEFITIVASRFFAGADAKNPASLLTVPLFHTTGLISQLLAAIRRGRKLVGMHKWNAEEALKLIEVEKITHIGGVPTMAVELVQSPEFDTTDTSSLVSIGLGGAALAPAHVKSIASAFTTTTPATGYGLTETNGLAATIGAANLIKRPKSCGRAVPPTVTVRIVDEDGKNCRAGQQGEILIYGAMNFSRYWNDEPATSATLVDGWVRTGDVGYMDDEEFLFITDRAKDLIIRGGENISCQEVEAVLYEHPGVRECAVFGITDDRLGEIVACVIRPRDGIALLPDEVAEHLQTRIARYKIPTQVQILHEPLPRTASGKIFKRALREKASGKNTTHPDKPTR
jgi:long-chain acyl-CoA synthetase